ncbi:MAG: ATP-binding cassette domain-containing protein [Lachnospiraceae bacterium]|nr:ATP-binding cassette domain-containing protein [Lachnospiraceae bacterium]
MICFEHVSKFNLSDVSIHVPEGASVGLIGASGAGKTTFLKLACGLLAPEQGYVHTMRKNPITYRSRLGSSMRVMLNDIPVLEEYNSVKSNFDDLRIIYRMSVSKFQEEYKLLADALGFGSYENEVVKALSLGQRRRAELGALLLTHPKLLLLDEPTIGLDQRAKEALRLLLTVRQKEGMALIISSHDMGEISALCERIALLDRGELTYYGGRELLLKRFAPIDTLEVTLSGPLPDLEDLPLHSFILDQNKLTLTYNSNHVSSAELLHHLLKQTTFTGVTTYKAQLADVIRQIEKGETNEFYRSKRGKQNLSGQ